MLNLTKAVEFEKPCSKLQDTKLRKRSLSVYAEGSRSEAEDSLLTTDSTHTADNHPTDSSYARSRSHYQVLLP